MGNITHFIVDGSDYFTAMVDDDRIRAGLVGWGCIDIPENHHAYADAVAAQSEREVEAFLDSLIESGVLSI